MSMKVNILYIYLGLLITQVFLSFGSFCHLRLLVIWVLLYGSPDHLGFLQLSFSISQGFCHLVLLSLGSSCVLFFQSTLFFKWPYTIESFLSNLFHVNSSIQLNFSKTFNLPYRNSSRHLTIYRGRLPHQQGSMETGLYTVSFLNRQQYTH